MKTNKYKAPLAIYVVWHPEFNRGIEFAEFLFSTFNRDINDPFARGIGIPVFYRYLADPQTGIPIEINLGEAQSSIVVVLIDDFCKINWSRYIGQLYEQFENTINDKNDNHRFFPVAFNQSALKIHPKVSENNFIRLYDHEIELNKDTLLQKSELKMRLTHEICRLFHELPRIADIEQYPSELRNNSPITLFLSHTKNGGVPITQAIKQFIETNTPAKSFFDSLDLISGKKFSIELEKHIEKSALIVIHTDKYSTREWCKWELIMAKKHNRPIVVVNALQDIETRSYPYMGNVPVIRWQESEIHNIFHFILLEILRFEYTYRLIDSQIRQYEGGHKIKKILASPPELFTLIYKAFEKGTKDKRVIYPDPPVTQEEKELLDELDDFEFLTPMTLAAYMNEQTEQP